MAKPTLAEQHLAFKENAAKVLHEAADDRDFCDSFDSIMISVGLSPRERFVRDNEDDRTNYYDENDRYVYRPYVRKPLVGERTAKEFAAWKRETGRKLFEEADRFGINGAESVLAEAGFEPPVEHQVFVEAVVRIPVTVKVYEGEDVIKGVNEGEVKRRIGDTARSWSRYGDAYLNDGKSVNWKVVTR